MQVKPGVLGNSSLLDLRSLPNLKQVKLHQLKICKCHLNFCDCSPDVKLFQLEFLSCTLLAESIPLEKHGSQAVEITTAQTCSVDLHGRCSVSAETFP